jgi:hypothetical protein
VAGYPDDPAWGVPGDTGRAAQFAAGGAQEMRLGDQGIDDEFARFGGFAGLAGFAGFVIIRHANMVTLAVMALEQISFTPSRNISSIAYDADSQQLFVMFKRAGHIYRYQRVAGEAAYGFSQALAANDYLKNYIQSNYVGEPITADELPQEISNKNL